MRDVTLDRLLIARIQSGDETALEAVLDANGQAIARVIGGTWPGIPPSDTEEVMADVLVECWRRVSEVDLERGTLTAWLAMVAKYRTLDRLRTNRRRHSLLDRLIQRSQEVVVIPEYASDLDWSLAGLSEIERRLVHLRFIEERPIREIASLLGLTEKATSRRLDRLRVALRKTIVDRPSQKEFPDVRTAR
jgi:RNA polymerase sigma-70 factor (ECF subfamily)